LHKKGLVVGIIILLILVNIGSTFAGDADVKTMSSVGFDGNIIVVDDEGDGDFTSIKEALSFANPGDTIEVYSGTYNENTIIIEIENITLQGIPYELGNGSDTGKPFIDGQEIENTFEIRSQNILVDGFRIENDIPSHYNTIIHIFDDAQYCVISNNDLSNSLHGIFSYGSNIQILNNNIIHSSIRNGIALREPSLNNIVQGIGIVLREPSLNNIVRGNVINGGDKGIDILDFGSNLIEDNIIRNCDRGIWIRCDNNFIQFNTFEENNLGLELDYTLGNWVVNNNFYNNNLNAQTWNTGLFAVLSHKWRGNYWDRGRIFPYPIPGLVLFFIWISFDWRPALVPNDIGV